jgi:hypothetical protein
MFTDLAFSMAVPKATQGDVPPADLKTFTVFPLVRTAIYRSVPLLVNRIAEISSLTDIAEVLKVVQVAVVSS